MTLEEQIKEARVMFDRGCSEAYIARVLGVSEHKVRYLLEQPR